jgi:hypothetical protein
VRCLALALAVVAQRAGAAQVQLAPGNGIWLKPASTPVPGNEAALITGLKGHSIKHVFLWTVGYSSTDYTAFTPFISQAHANGLTVHAICATKSTVSSGSQLSPVLLSNALNEVFTYNTNHPSAAFDGVQVDIESVYGTNLVALLAGVHVPNTLVFSADVQTSENWPGIENSYGTLLQTTDLDLLIPMIYIVDGIYYSGGAPSFPFNIARVKSKTASLISLLPASGRLMSGLSVYDNEFRVQKSTGAIDPDYPDASNQPAFSTYSGSAYSVPNLVGHGYPLVDVTYLTNTGISQYRFGYDSVDWLDVLEVTPIGLRRSITSADQGGAGDSRYVGTCSWLYNTVFDPYINRQQGLIADDGLHPDPRATVQVLSYQGGVARLRVTLTNANPAELVLGAHAAAGVHLELTGGTFLTADPGSFHAAEAFNGSGTVLPAVNGSQVIELRRSFFENSAAPQAVTGEITLSAPLLFTLKYRSWMMDKDSLCNDLGTSEPYVARSPDDVHYSDASKFLSLATFVTNRVASEMCPYARSVLADQPVSYHRFGETGVVTTATPFAAANSGTLGAAGNGTAGPIINGASTRIASVRPGLLSTPDSGAFAFPAGETNTVVVPYRTDWNKTGPFSVEFWAKGGAGFSCPISSVEFDTRGWLFYQGNDAQTTGNGWWFRMYKSGSQRVDAKINLTVNTNAWYHIVGVYDGANLVLYTNGAQAVLAPLGGTYVPNTNAANALTFGARSGTGSWSYAGMLDEVAFYGIALSASQVAAHFAAATANPAGYAGQILAHNPPGYWRLDDALTPPVATNSSGETGLDGLYLNWSTTVPGALPPAYPGLDTANRALDVFGTNGQVSIPPLNLNTNTVTLECWLKRRGDQADGAGLVTHRNADGSGGCGLNFHGTANHLGYRWNDSASTYNWDSGLVPPEGKWVYVALTIRAAQAVLCLCDGTTWTTSTNTASHASQAFAGPLRVGTDGGTNRWFNGSIDEVAVYDRTLAQDHLCDHALAGFGNTNQPLFLSTPASQTVQLGALVYFKAAAFGAPTIQYQWRKDGAVVTGAAGPSLLLPVVDYTNAGFYDVSATNSYGGVTCPPAALVVLPPPWITNLTYRTSAATPAGLELIWPSGALYSAEAVTGPWVAVTNAASPYYKVPIDRNVTGRFYRVQ